MFSVLMAPFKEILVDEKKTVIWCKILVQFWLNGSNMCDTKTIASRNLQKMTIYIYYMYIIISLNHILYISIYIFYISPIYI